MYLTKIVAQRYVYSYYLKRIASKNIHSVSKIAVFLPNMSNQFGINWHFS